MKKAPYWLATLITLILLLVAFSPGTGCQQQKSAVQKVDFTASPASGNAPLTVQFTDQSIGDISSWLWFFGDGQTSTEQNPIHRYTGDGAYNVSLVVLKPDGSHETMSKEDYVYVGNPAPPWTLTMQEVLYWDYDIPPQSEFVTLDLAGEGIIYWTSFNVKDKGGGNRGITHRYEHNIYIDGKEIYGELNSVVEIWTFQQNAVRTPDSFYPAIYSTGQDFLYQAFGRLDIPFNGTLSVTSANTHPEGIVTVNMVHAAYGLAGSGVPSSTGGRRGEEWGINKTSDELEFPVAPKLKTALEKEFGKEVFSVGIIRRSRLDDPETYFLLWVDAPEIERDEIRDFLVREELIELAYELE